MGVISGGRMSDRDIQLSGIGRKNTGWVSTGDSVTIADIDRSGGGFSITTAGNDNEGGTYVYGGEMFDFGDVGCRCTLSAKVNFNQHASNPADMFIGFSDTADADVVTDSDALQTQDAIGFWVVGGTDFWRTAAINASTDSGETTTTAHTDATTYDIRIEVEGLTGGLTIRYYVDNVLVDTVTGFAYASFGPELQLCVSVKNKGASANVLNIYSMDVSHRAMS